MHNAIALVLARGGSKGVPGKNVANIAGKPCIAWTIAHAQAAKHVARVVVSSDDPRAIAVARACGCEIVERPAELASDTARIDDAARHAIFAIEHARDATQVRVDVPIVVLYANVPVRPDGLIDRCVQLLVESGCDSVQSYQPVGKHHPWWTARVGDDGCVSPWEGAVLNHGVFRRQDLPAAHVPDGAIIALTRRALFCEIAGVQAGPHAFFGKDRRGVVNAEGSVVDIDTRYDLLVADAVLRGER
jgi:CMP-N,N'-diacetyllegionaminic acid synthase